MMNKYTRLKFSCYTTSITMSIVASISPVLFLTFHSLYDISYSLLGLLVLVNFTTQLIVDLLFSFFSQKFNIPKVVKFTPLINIIGMLIYALWPFIFPNNVYIGLLIGTIIFSAASGFAEVLISPVIASIPSEQPDREMSKLHSVFAWGVVFAIILSTLFIYLFGAANWQLLVVLFILVPVVSFVLFLGTDIPEMSKPSHMSGVIKQLKNRKLWLCIVIIFLGGAAECTMSQWASGYLEKSLSIPKLWGDIFGVALFSVMMGIGRSLYAKKGKNIINVLLAGGIAATICYIVAATTNLSVSGLIACAFTGLCVSMFWPGSLIVVSDKIPDSGVLVYAMMAAGGDLGASVGPQIIGIITDTAIKNPNLVSLAYTMNMLPEQLGMKLGILFAAVFPSILTLIIIFSFRKTQKVISK